MFPDELKKSVESFLTTNTGSSVHISANRAVGGGCINETYLLQTTSGKYFIKYNSKETFPGMFEKEASGLKMLAATQAIQVPEVIGSGHSDRNAYLLLQYVESGPPGRNFWQHFGTQLAHLHQNSNEYFGLDQDNYMGSLIQKNKPHPDFLSFFISERIEPQVKMARDKGELSLNDIHYFDSLFKSLHDIIPVEKPALVHGDLWNGNFLVTLEGSPCLIDPAVHFGHREADIAMTKLFGGFQPEFYQAYDWAWPMEKGWQERMDMFNLYPLLVHVNLFGGSYAQQVLQIIRRF